MQNNINIYSCKMPNNTTISLTEENINTLNKRYPDLDIQSYCYAIEDYCNAKNKNYKSLMQTLNNWVSKESGNYKKITGIERMKKQYPNFQIRERDTNDYMMSNSECVFTWINGEINILSGELNV